MQSLLRSPLRVQLIELLLHNGGPRGMAALAVDVAAPESDVEGCITPLLRSGWLEETTARTVRVVAARASDLRGAIARIDPLVAAAVERTKSLQRGPLARIIGHGERMRMVLEQTQMAARNRVDVLILGETGTGKELIARAIHDLSARASGPFVPVNTADLPADLFEAEPLGHAKGADPGVTGARRGRLGAADGGTLFVDEIAELDLGAQAKMLRAIQERAVLSLGASREVLADFRLIAATSRPIADMAREGSFREDLLYRINAFTIWLPPLRERPEDIPELAAHLAATATEHGMPATPGPSAAACARLSDELWPGNVRQLQSVVLRAAFLACGEPIEAHHVEQALAPTERESAASPARRGEGSRVSLDAIIRKRVLDALRNTGGNVTAAARALAGSKMTLYRELDAWEPESAGLLADRRVDR